MKETKQTTVKEVNTVKTTPALLPTFLVGRAALVSCSGFWFRVSQADLFKTLETAKELTVTYYKAQPNALYISRIVKNKDLAV